MKLSIRKRYFGLKIRHFQAKEMGMKSQVKHKKRYSTQRKITKLTPRIQHRDCINRDWLLRSSETATVPMRKPIG